MTANKLVLPAYWTLDVISDLIEKTISHRIKTFRFDYLLFMYELRSNNPEGEIIIEDCKDPELAEYLALFIKFQQL